VTLTPRRRPVSSDDSADAGRAVVEVIWLAVLVLIPVVYILLSIIRIQATTFAVTQAARDAARILDTSPNLAVGLQGANGAARQAMLDQNIPPDAMTLTFVATGTDCATAPRVAPTLTPGSTVDVCVQTLLDLPLLPTELTAGNTATGVYTLRVGEFRERR
jgi:hypothetical protein